MESMLLWVRHDTEQARCFMVDGEFNMVQQNMRSLWLSFALDRILPLLESLRFLSFLFFEVNSQVNEGQFMRGSSASNRRQQKTF